MTLNPASQPCGTCRCYRADQRPSCADGNGGDVLPDWTGCIAWAPRLTAPPPPPRPVVQLPAYSQIPAGAGHATVLPDFDFEAYSEAGYYWDGPANKWRGITKTDPGIAAVGAAVYTEHPSCEVLSLAYDLKDGRGDRLWLPGMPPPQDLFDHITSGGLLEAWNSGFEFWLWHNVCHLRMGWPALPYTQLRCAMSKARAHSLPGALGAAAKAIGAGEQKDPKGDALIRKLCIPRTPTTKQIRTVEMERDALTGEWYTLCAAPPSPANTARCFEISGRFGELAGTLPGINRATPQNCPEDFQAFYQYNRQDIKAEAAISQMCPDLSPCELELWLTDQAINLRGVHIDQAALNDCVAIVEQASGLYTAELYLLTNGAVQSASELQAIQRWLAGKGVRTPTLDADAVAELLHGDDNWLIPDDCRRVLEIRSSLGAASVKKLFAIQRRLPRDGRLRDLFAFCGADRTGRWAGRGPQPQNLTSSGPDVCECKACGRVFWEGLLLCPDCGKLRGPNDRCDWGIRAVEVALKDIATRNLAHVEARWGDAIAVVAGCLRGLFASAPGYDFICSDFSAIEAVVLAELAGEEWRQEVFRTHGKIYEAGASKITGIPFEEFMHCAGYDDTISPEWWTRKARKGKHHPMRKKVGKVSELASGFGGGVGAWKAFGADKFMTDDEIQKNIWAWREASPAIAGSRKLGIQGFWYGLQEAAYAAVSCPGYAYSYQAPATQFGQPPPITYFVKDNILYCALPSGRLLTYHKPRLAQETNSFSGRTELRLTYWGYNSDYKKGPKGWMELDTWGGKLTENVVQAVARDILAHSMPALERAGYPIVLHVHDEVVSEVPAGTGDVKEFEAIMGTMPTWAAGWPIKAAGGWRGQRYRKD